MYTHMTVGSNDIERSRKFYDATFGALGAKPGFTDPKGRLVYMHKGGVLLVTKPIDGAAATAGNGSTIGLHMDNPEQADKWHAAGAANGGQSIEDAPGKRADSGFYLAYLRDPDGNKLCAFYNG